MPPMLILQWRVLYLHAEKAQIHFRNSYYVYSFIQYQVYGWHWHINLLLSFSLSGSCLRVRHRHELNIGEQESQSGARQCIQVQFKLQLVFSFLLFYYSSVYVLCICEWGQLNNGNLYWLKWLSEWMNEENRRTSKQLLSPHNSLWFLRCNFIFT